MKNLNEISQKSLEIVKNTGILSPYNEVITAYENPPKSKEIG